MITLTVAQCQSLALKTMGFRDEHEIKVERPHQDSSAIRFDIYHVTIEIDENGAWEATARNSGEFLGCGRVPNLGMRRDGEPLPL